MGKVKEVMQTEPCRFCGQMVQFMGDGDLTEPQAQEIATMNCSCDEAVDYVKLLMAAVEEIYTGGLAKVTINLRGGVKASVSQNSKGEINVERTETKKQKLTE